MEETELIRELSSSEEFFLHSTKYESYYPVQMIHLKGKLNPKLFQEAICLVLEKYKILQTFIVEHEGKYYFKYEKDYKQRFMKENLEFYEKKHENDWIEHYKRELKEGSLKFTSQVREKGELTGLLLRIQLIYHEKFEISNLIIGYHHSLFDGSSLCMVMNDIFEFTKILMKEEKVVFEIREIEPARSLKNNESSSKEGLCDLPIKIKEAKERETYFNFVKINKSDMEKVIKKVKENKSTINSLIVTSLVYTAVKYLFQEKGKWFNFWNAVSQRNYTDLDKKSIGLYASIVSVPITIEDELFEYKPKEFWDKVKVYQQKILNSIDNGKGLRAFDPKKIIEVPLDLFSNYPFTRSSSIGLSNRGVLDSYIKENYEFFAIDGFYLAITYHNMGALLNVSCSTINGSCYLSFMGCTPLIERSVYDSMVKHFIQIFLDDQ